MAIQVLVLLLACITITTTTTTTTTSTSTNFTSSHNSTSTIAVNAKIGLVKTQTNPNDKIKSLKLEVLYRDKIHPSSFQQLIKRDAKRVANLIRQLDEDGVYYPEVDHFRENISSDLGSGDYFIPVGLGTPPTPQYLSIDTASDLGWVQCQPCVQCPPPSQHLFHPTQSSSFSEIPCDSYACNLLQKKNCEASRCMFEVIYGDKSYSQGNLALESMVFGEVLIKNYTFGCAHSHDVDLAGETGVIGLGPGAFSLVSQLGDQVDWAFSYCLPRRGSGTSGSLVLGRESIPKGVAWTSLLSSKRGNNFYYIDLVGLGVDGIRLPIREDVFHISKSGYGGVIMDTDTTLSWLTKVAYEALRDAFVVKTTDIPRVPGVDRLDTCYNLSGFAYQLPTISFYFSGGTILNIPAVNYLIVGDGRVSCLAFGSSPWDFSVIGNIQQEQIQITIDMASKSVGFGPNNC